MFVKSLLVPCRVSSLLNGLHFNMTALLAMQALFQLHDQRLSGYAFPGTCQECIILISNCQLPHPEFKRRRGALDDRHSIYPYRGMHSDTSVLVDRLVLSPCVQHGGSTGNQQHPLPNVCTMCNTICRRLMPPYYMYFIGVEVTY